VLLTRKWDREKWKEEKAKWREDLEREEKRWREQTEREDRIRREGYEREQERLRAHQVREDQTRFHNERRAAYARFIALVQRLPRVLESAVDMTQEQRDMDVAHTEILLLGSSPVTEAALEIFDRLHEVLAYGMRKEFTPDSEYDKLMENLNERLASFIFAARSEFNIRDDSKPSILG
jgi:hypothetical protein